MNQAIQFPDREQWDEAQQAILFPALVNGMQIQCALSQSSLIARFGLLNKEAWIAQFQQCRWDIEDEAESLIKDEAWDDTGIVWLP